MEIVSNFTGNSPCHVRKQRRLSEHILSTWLSYANAYIEHVPKYEAGVYGVAYLVT